MSHSVVVAALALVACLLGLVPVLPVRPATAASTAFQIRTVPAIKGIVFRADGRRLATNDDGVVRIAASAGNHKISTRSNVRLGSRRLTFVRWSDGSTEPRRSLEGDAPFHLTAYFESDLLVHISLSGQLGDGRRETIERLIVRNDLEESFAIDPDSPGLAGPTALLWDRHPPGTNWLPATRIDLVDGEPKESSVVYEVVRAVADEPVRVAAASFRPATGRTWAVRLQVDSGVMAGNSRLPLWLALISTAVLIGILAGRRLRRRRRAAIDSSGSRPAPRPARQHPEEVDPLEPSSATARRYVIVQLTDGRTIEGWLPTIADASLRDLVILDVVDVRGPDGKPVPASPSDAFVARSEIAGMRSPGEPSSAREVGPTLPLEAQADRSS